MRASCEGLCVVHYQVQECVCVSACVCKCVCVCVIVCVQVCHCASVCMYICVIVYCVNMCVVYKLVCISFVLTKLFRILQYVFITLLKNTQTNA